VKLLGSLIDTVERLEADALVLQAGEKPYAVTASSPKSSPCSPLVHGHVELSSHVLTPDAVLGMVTDLLPLEHCKVLDHEGTVQYKLPQPTGFGSPVTVLAQCRGTDVRLELRRGADAAPADATTEGTSASVPAVLPEPRAIASATHEPPKPAIDNDLREDLEAVLAARISERLSEADLLVVPFAESAAHARGPVAAGRRNSRTEELLQSQALHGVAGLIGAVPSEPGRAEPAHVLDEAGPACTETLPEPRAGGTLDRSIESVVRIALERNATAVYAASNSQLMMRVNDEIRTIEELPVFTVADIEQLTRDLADLTNRASSGERSDRILEEAGRIRHVTFRDHSGPGVILRLRPLHALAEQQLAIPAHLQEVCLESDGLILVTNPPGGIPSTLLRALVEAINRSRNDHVTTIESRTDFPLARGRSFISRREPAGTLADAIHQALDEDPDVLVIEQLDSAESVLLAFEAAQNGRLVICGIEAPDASSAVERLLSFFPGEQVRDLRTSVAARLRGVVAQVLVRRMKGGRVAAWEFLLNTPAVAALIVDGRLSDLRRAIEDGRADGMMPLVDSLAALVRDGIVSLESACRRTVNRDALIAAVTEMSLSASS
jgi:twitching motility protein PilT